MLGSPEAVLFQQYLIKHQHPRHLSKGDLRGNNEMQEGGRGFHFQDISWT